MARMSRTAANSPASGICHHEPPTTERPEAAWFALVLALATSCRTNDPPPTKPTAMTSPGQKQPDEPLPFVHGPALTDTDDLLRWLPAQLDGDGPAIVQLAVAGPEPQALRPTGRLAARNGSAGVELQLDDTALGIALSDHWRLRPTTTPPVAWLEGRWNPKTRPPTFVVTRWLGHIPTARLDAPRFARRIVPADSDPALVVALDQLGSEASATTKEDACRRLVAAGLASVPLLLLSRDDGRTFAIRDSVNRIDPPPFERPAPDLVTSTVGSRCEELLYAIVTPAPRQAHDHRGKVFSTQVLAIADWASFWHKRRGRTLAEIHAELAPLVDAYWARKGITQRVD